MATRIMGPMPLPASYRWADASDGTSNLYLRYGSVASIKPDGTMKLKYWQKEFHAKAASAAQAKRFIERWINARNSARAHECARWRNQYHRKAATASIRGRFEDDLIFVRATKPTCTGGLNPRVIKMSSVQEDLDEIWDVGRPLRLVRQFAVSNVGANSSVSETSSR